METLVDLIRRSIITLLDHFLLGLLIILHTCWISVGTGSSRSAHILAPLYLPGVAAAVHTVCAFPPQKRLHALSSGAPEKVNNQGFGMYFPYIKLNLVIIDSDFIILGLHLLIFGLDNCTML